MSFALPTSDLLVSGLFHRHGEAYTWTNPTCCVHNVLVGKLWIEQYGTVEIVNHRCRRARRPPGGASARLPVPVRRAGPSGTGAVLVSSPVPVVASCFGVRHEHEFILKLQT